MSHVMKKSVFRVFVQVWLCFRSKLVVKFLVKASIQEVNNKDTDQTVRMRRQSASLLFAYGIRQVFSHNSYFLYLRSSSMKSVSTLAYIGGPLHLSPVTKKQVSYSQPGKTQN